MKRLLATMRTDIRLQQRNGFYYASAFVLGIYALAITQLPVPGARLAWLLPAMVLNNLLISSFYFIGGMVLLEKTDGTLDAQVATPLRTWEYIWSKALTLALLGLAYNGAIAALVAGPRAALALAPGLVCAALLYALFGLVAVARYASLNEFLLPSLLYAGALAMPIGPYALGWEHPLMYLHPLQAPLVLMRAAAEPVPAGLLLYGLAYSAASIALAYRLARHTFERALAWQF